MENQTNNTKKIALAVGGYIAFALIAYTVMSGLSMGFDAPVREFILSLRGAMDGFFVVFAYSGNWFCVVPICLILLILPKTRFSYGIPVTASVLVAQVFYNVLKRIFQRPRPDWSLHLVKEHGFSFPSGHSMVSFASAVVLLQYDKRIGIPAIILAALIAFSRLYLYVHFPTDVLVGTLMGILFGILAPRIVEYIYSRRKTS